jgi:hypothetical protein
VMFLKCFDVETSVHTNNELQPMQNSIRSTYKKILTFGLAEHLHKRLIVVRSSRGREKVNTNQSMLKGFKNEWERILFDVCEEMKNQEHFLKDHKDNTKKEKQKRVKL